MTQGRDELLPSGLEERPPQPLPALRGCGQSDVGMVTSLPVSPSSASCCDKEAPRSGVGPCGLRRLRNRRESGGLGTGLGSGSAGGGGCRLHSAAGNNGAVAPATGGGLSRGLQAETGRRCPKKGRLGAGAVGAVLGAACPPLPPPPPGRAAGLLSREESSLWTHSAEPQRGDKRERFSPGHVGALG